MCQQTLYMRMEELCASTFVIKSYHFTTDKPFCSVEEKRNDVLNLLLTSD